MIAKRWLKRMVGWSCGMGLAVLVCYFCIEQAMLFKISKELKRTYGDNYAVLSLHMGGKSFAKPALWRMLRLVYEYRVSDKYLPQGSGRFTGKKYYLTMLLTDNEVIKVAHWSFRGFQLKIAEDRGAPWDYIKYLPAETVDLYRFNEENRTKRQGLWYKTEAFNHPELSFYYRSMSKDLDRKQISEEWPGWL
jgi:hypothetical protein